MEKGSHREEGEGGESRGREGAWLCPALSTLTGGGCWASLWGPYSEGEDIGP